MLVGVAEGVAEFGVLLTGMVLPGAVAGAVLAAGELLAPLGVVLAVAAGAVLAGELLAPLGVVLVAGAVAAAPVALADGAGDGLAGALPTVPPPRVVP